MNKLMWGIFTTMCTVAPFMDVVAFAADKAKEPFVTGGSLLASVICGAGASGGWLWLLWARSHTRKIAKNADDYVKKESGGRSVITNERDAFVRSEYDHRKTN